MNERFFTAQPKELTADFAKGYYAALLTQMKDLPANSEAWIEFLSHWNEFKAYLSGENSRRSLKESQNTADKKAEEEAAFMREKIVPIAEEYDAQIRETLLASPFLPQMEKHFGKLLFTNFKVAQSAFDPANIKLNTEIANLTARYGKISGSAKVLIDGKEYTLPLANAMLDDPSETKRKNAWLAIAKWTSDHDAELQDTYSQLVALRHRLALNLHEKNFVPVGYKKMQRVDYGPAEVKAFRDEIKKHVVPLLAKFRKQQALNLKAETVKPWNMKYYPGLSLDPHVLDVQAEAEKAQKLFDRLDPHLGDTFRKMSHSKSMDLANRPNKVPGAFCTNFDDEKTAFIFCNNTGSSDDVGTLTHEMGHAFQITDSMWIEPIELRWPTYEACEVHSMGMEYLSLPLLDEFFKPEEAAKYRKLRLIDTLTMLPYIATVDEFQHWVYEHPENSPAERDAAWNRIWDEYNVGVDFTGYDKAKASRWKRQNHIFFDPFYYIDYGIAEAGALQLYEINEQNHKQAMDSYLKLCHIGGSQSLLSIFKSANLKSPFTPGLFKPIMASMAEELGIR